MPPPPAGTNFRFFWSTPFILSPHNPRTIYLGAERLFRSYDRGDTWTASPDLTRNIGRNDRPIMGVDGKAPMASKHDGAASYSNIVTISESYMVPGILWVGTNDGNVQVSRDGGATWKNVIEKVPGAPKEGHISRVEASHFDAGTAYLTIDNHRFDDHKPYVYKTTDFGETWTSITGNLPEGNVNVIREDPKNRNLLYLGNEYGFYVTLNGGREWKRFMNGLPTVRVDDILVHPRDNDLIIGTHGRSIWIIDDITPLQQLSDRLTDGDAHVFDVRPAVAYATDIQKAIWAEGANVFKATNPQRGTAISYWLKTAPPGDVKITISDIMGRGDPGHGRHEDRRDEPRPVEPRADTSRRRTRRRWWCSRQRRKPARRHPWHPGAVCSRLPRVRPAPLSAARNRSSRRYRHNRAAVAAAGGGNIAVPAGTYLVKVMLGDKVIGQKTVVVEADTTFMQ